MEQEDQINEDVDIEAIMQDIRRQILSQRRIGKADLPIAGSRFSPAFYEQLYQASLMQSETGVTVNITKSTLPLFGPLIDKLRGMFHQLVLYYVEQVVARQDSVNEHLLQAISLLSQELEAEVDLEQDDLSTGTE